jgi:riboflavin synthase
MFTGIIEETGRVLSFSQGEQAWRLKLEASAVMKGLAEGDSIAVNGCCLTSVAFSKNTLEFDLLEETVRLTNFSRLAPGALVNLERSLAFGGKIGGHFVTGHIDGLGLIEVFERRGNDFFLKVQGPSGCARNLIHKGSIAIDGISLTVAETQGDSLSAWLIPHTCAVTNLSSRKKGDLVNLEFDMLGKYVDKLLSLRS